jgi:hypothetical protein
MKEELFKARNLISSGMDEVQKLKKMVYKTKKSL